MAQDRCRGGLVQHLEARGNAGFQREALQERLAESVDGEDVDAARSVEHAREQAAGGDSLFLLGRPIDQGLDLLIELGLVGHRPTAELARQPVRISAAAALVKVGGGSARGPRAGEQQARHAVGQNLGLAGAGIGLDPGGMGWCGGLALLAAGQKQGIEGVAHSSPPPAVDHSATRSRCS